MVLSRSHVQELFSYVYTLLLLLCIAMSFRALIVMEEFGTALFWSCSMAKTNLSLSQYTEAYILEERLKPIGLTLTKLSVSIFQY